MHRGAECEFQKPRLRPQPQSANVAGREHIMADVAFDLATLLGASRQCQVPNIAAGDSIHGFVVGCVHVDSEMQTLAETIIWVSVASLWSPTHSDLWPFTSTTRHLRPLATLGFSISWKPQRWLRCPENPSWSAAPTGTNNHRPTDHQRFSFPFWCFSESSSPRLQAWKQWVAVM